MKEQGEGELGSYIPEILFVKRGNPHFSRNLENQIITPLMQYSQNEEFVRAELSNKSGVGGAEKYKKEQCVPGEEEK